MSAASSVWRVREVMAARGLRFSTDLMAPLAERGVVLSRAQVYRIVNEQPQRLSLTLLLALCDVLDCGVEDLVAVTARPAGKAHPDQGGLRRKSAATHESGRPSEARHRLLEAMAACIEAEGYGNTTIADIVDRARASRRTFYQHFGNREDCLVALLADTNKETIRDIADAIDSSAAWQTQIRQGVQAWIASAKSRPGVTVSWIRDLPTLGAAAQQLQRDVLHAFIGMLQRLSDTEQLRAAGIAPVTTARATVLIGGLRELIATTVENAGQLDDIVDDAVDACIALGRPD